MRIASATSVIVLCLLGTASAEDLFSSKPVWSSRTGNSGGDGIARFIDVDRDGDADFLTSRSTGTTVANSPRPLRGR